MTVELIQSGQQVIQEYVDVLGQKKAASPFWRLFLLGVAGGMLVAFGGVAAVTASHAMENPGLARLVSGLLFPIGLSLAMLTGAELFPGNAMMAVSAIHRRISTLSMLKCWLAVYLGNFLGATLVAAGVVYSGQLDLNGGAPSVYTIQIAADKCQLPFGSAVVLGIFCNILVCLGVLCSLTAKDTGGRILGAYLPVVFFITAGFENIVANMYYIPAGMLAAAQPHYRQLALAAGVDMTGLGLSGLAANMIPVTIGNAIGGAGIAMLLFQCHKLTAPPDTNYEKPWER